PSTVVLNAGRPNIPAIVGAQLPVPAGCIMQIRMITDAMQISLNGNPQDVKVPSGSQTGIKIVPVDESKPFTVATNATTLVRVEYNPTTALVFNQPQGVIEKPILIGTQLDPDLAIGVVLDQLVLTFEPGTSQSDIASLVASAGDAILAQYPT